MPELRASQETKFSDEDRLTEILLGLECSLMDPVFRKDRERVSALLAEEFREFGASGRVWSRTAIVELLAAETSKSAPAVKDFAVQRISAETVLATYRAVRESMGDAPAQASLRSSLWVWRGGCWQMLFHQGTQIPNA